MGWSRSQMASGSGDGARAAARGGIAIGGRRQTRAPPRGPPAASVRPSEESATQYALPPSPTSWRETRRATTALPRRNSSMASSSASLSSSSSLSSSLPPSPSLSSSPSRATCHTETSAGGGGAPGRASVFSAASATASRVPATSARPSTEAGGPRALGRARTRVTNSQRSGGSASGAARGRDASGARSHTPTSPDSSPAHTRSPAAATARTPPRAATGASRRRRRRAAAARRSRAARRKEHDAVRGRADADAQRDVVVGARPEARALDAAVRSQPVRARAVVVADKDEVVVHGARVDYGSTLQHDPARRGIGEGRHSHKSTRTRLNLPRDLLQHTLDFCSTDESAFYTMLRTAIAFASMIAAARALPAADEITALPGWTGALPSRQFSGYLDASPTKHLHYWMSFSEGARDRPRRLLVQRRPGLQLARRLPLRARAVPRADGRRRHDGARGV